MTTPSADLARRIAVLERKIEREKKARQMAEQQLEQYSRDIYQTNQSLQTSLAYSNKKQAELEFLAKESVLVGSESSFQDLVSNTIELSSMFLKAKYSFSLISKNGTPVNLDKNKVWGQELGWHSAPEFLDKAIQYLPLNHDGALETWLVSPIDNNFGPEVAELHWLVYVNFALTNGSIIWLAFFNDTEYVDEESLYVFETVRGQLQSGIRRRMTDMRILKRTVQLQNTVNSLEQAKRQLIQSEKMASLGQLAAGVAHEINNPIGFIRSNLEMLKLYLKDYRQLHLEIDQLMQQQDSIDALSYQQLYEKLDMAYIESDSEELIIANIEGLDRVSDIVDNLKTFSHNSNGELQPVSLYESIVGALKISANSLKYEHTVDNQLPAVSPMVMGNSGQLQQVFVNLFVNAAYAMANGGTLSISAQQSNKLVTIKIADTGCGMDDKTLKKLFTPFFTTKPVGVGTGLGLSVSYAILEAHNVELHVESQVNVGTTFELIFPIVSI